MTINDYFDKIYCINLDRRPDRWAEAQAEAKAFGIEMERVSGVDGILDGKPHGHFGCKQSHKVCWQKILDNKFKRALILEDDFRIYYSNFHERFGDMIRFVPADWDIIYLGGGYGNDPISRAHLFVIRCDRMLGTQSYGITAKHAERLLKRPSLNGDPIDIFISESAMEHKHYILSPRLIVQRSSYSDITNETNLHPDWSMTDPRHERMV